MALTRVHNRLIAGAPVNVKDFGAVGDGVTDDAPAVQLAVDAAVAGSGIVYFPAATYLLNASVGPAVEAFGLHYTGDGIQKTVITGNHNEGAVLFLNRSNAQVSNLTINSSASRTAGSNTSTGGTWADNVGLLIEPPDVAFKATAQCELNHVRILGQPSHGLAWIGAQQDNSMNHVLCQDNIGHGAVFDGGIINGRVNLQQMGQMTATDYWKVLIMAVTVWSLETQQTLRQRCHTAMYLLTWNLQAMAQMQQLATRSMRCG